MKKGTIIALIVAAAMLIVGASLVWLAQDRGEDIWEAFRIHPGTSVSNGVINIGGSQKDYTVCLSGEESFDAAEVKSLDVDWVSGAVSVEAWNGETIVIRENAAEPLTEGQRMRWKLSGGTLSILFCANGENRVPDKTLTVQVQRYLLLVSVDVDAVSAPVTLSGLRVESDIDSDTTSGAVLARSCICKALDVDTVSGGIRLEDTNAAGAIDLDTTSGKIFMSACSSASLDIDTVSGRVEGEALSVGKDVNLDSGSGAIVMRALTVGGQVDVDTGSGEVELRFSGLPASVDVDTGSGDVRLAFPKGTTIDLDFDTASGKMSGAYSFAPKGLPVDVDTSSGDLTIEED